MTRQLYYELTDNGNQHRWRCPLCNQVIRNIPTKKWNDMSSIARDAFSDELWAAQEAHHKAVHSNE